MKIEEFKRLLNEKTITFEYVKKDGSVRTAHGTTKLDVIPDEHHPKGTGDNIANPDVVKYFDMDKDGWRSFIFDESTTKVLWLL